ncbi:MAG: flagellar hook assembly protein FlgD [Gammaproteobacteria bacterium]|nr:flagellar hook assembly protein FlgD [Gammaproteobacteria bacterium]
MESISEINPFAKFGFSQLAESEGEGKILQEDFLELMVTQLRNQDPFKPMESGEFLGQLAQFGTVSGIDGLEAAFTDLAGSLSSNQALQAASLIGREVLLDSNVGGLTEEGSMNGVVQLPIAAQHVSVGVYDSSGRLVKRLDLGTQPEGQVEFAWDGLDEQGQPQPSGIYELRAEASAAGVSRAVDVMVSARVSSVTLGGAGEPLSLEIEGLGNVEFSQVKRIA